MQSRLLLCECVHTYIFRMGNHFALKFMNTSIVLNVRFLHLCVHAVEYTRRLIESFTAEIVVVFCELFPRRLIPRYKMKESSLFFLSNHIIMRPMIVHNCTKNCSIQVCYILFHHRIILSVESTRIIIIKSISYYSILQFNDSSATEPLALYCTTTLNFLFRSVSFNIVCINLILFN